MGITIKENGKVAVTEEVTEGTYVAPSSGGQFIQVLSDGLEVTGVKESNERNILNGSIGMSTSRDGSRSVTAAMSVEMKAGSTEGSAPEADPLLKAAFGSSRTVLTKTSSDAESSATYTSTVIALDDGDAATYNIGDIITTKRSGAFHTSPITAVVTTGGANQITLLVPDPAGVYVDGIVITAATTYVPTNSGHPSLSISKYVEDAVLEQGTGVRVSSMTLNNWTTGVLADIGFSLEGLDFDRSLTAPPVTASFDTSFPPTILKACLFLDGTLLDISDIAISLENSLAWVSPTCSPTGRSAGRVAGRAITGTFTPYKQDDDISLFDKFNDKTEFSIFITAHVPTTTSGEYDQVVSWYMPNVVMTELGEGDADGILQEAISYMAGRGGEGNEEEIYLSVN